MREIDPRDWDAERWTWLAGVRHDAGLTVSARLLAHILVLDFANRRTARCDPGMVTLARDMGVSRDTVRRLLRELCAARWIEIEEARGRGKRSGIVFLSRGQVVAFRPEKGSTGAPSKGGVHATVSGGEKVASVPRKGSTRAHPYKEAGTIEETRGAPSDDQIAASALWWAEWIGSGKPVHGGRLGDAILSKIIEDGLLSPDQLRAAGIDC